MKNKKFNVILGSTIIVGVLLIGLTYLWQHSKVNELNSQVAALKANQLPSKSFTSYTDCVSNGGLQLQYNQAISFDGCLAKGNDLLLQFNSQNLPRVSKDGTQGKANLVKNSNLASSDLVDFLTHDNTGCNANANNNATGYYKVLKEIPNRFALVNYGCSNDSQSNLDSQYDIAIKLGDGWSWISPTNNFDNEGHPSCLLVDMFQISKQISSECYQNTGYNDGSLRAVKYD